MKKYILMLCLLGMLLNVYAQPSIPKSALPKTVQPKKEETKGKPQPVNTAEQRKKVLESRSSKGSIWVGSFSNGVISGEVSKLVGSGAVGDAKQGFSVSLSADGNTAIVGGFGDDDYKGAVWIYRYVNGVWRQQGSKLVGSGAVGSAYQGSSVSLSADGNTAIAGGEHDDDEKGAVWIYRNENGIWRQQGSKLVGSGAVGDALQGRSVSLSADGNTAIVGGWRDDDYKGAVWIYRYVNGVWRQQGSKLVGSGAVGDADQGRSVSLSADGNTAIVGGSSDDRYKGAVWIYRNENGVWRQQGSKQVGSGALRSYFKQGFSYFHSSDGNTVIAGGEYDDGDKGAVWIYREVNGEWQEQGSKLVGPRALGDAYQGSSVSLSADGNTAIVGGYKDDGYKGAVWIYRFSN